MKSNIVHICMIILVFMAITGRDRVEAGEAIQSAGDVAALLLPATAGISSLLQRDFEGTAQLVKGTALSLGGTLLLKYTVDETRPNGDDDDSFPSGHAAISFSSAEFIRKRYGWEYGMPAYAAAAFVGYSRVESDQHYLHDVLAGAAIGIGSSYLFTTPYGTLNVAGEAGPGYFGLRLASTW